MNIIPTPQMIQPTTTPRSADAATYASTISVCESGEVSTSWIYSFHRPWKIEKEAFSKALEMVPNTTRPGRMNRM